MRLRACQICEYVIVHADFANILTDLSEYLLNQFIPLLPAVWEVVWSKLSHIGPNGI